MGRSLKIGPARNSCHKTVAKHRIPRRNRGGRGSKPQEYCLYFEDFEPKPDKEFGRKPKFCKGLAMPYKIFDELAALAGHAAGSLEGRMMHLAPIVRLSETPAWWTLPAVPLGTHAAAWENGKRN